MEKDFTYDKSRKTNWVKPRKISAHHLSYNELIMILSYCDIDTTVSLLDIEDAFIYNANIMSIRDNVSPY